MAMSVVDWVRSFFVKPPEEINFSSGEEQLEKGLWQGFARRKEDQEASKSWFRKNIWGWISLPGDAVLFELWRIRNGYLRAALKLAKWLWGKYWELPRWAKILFFIPWIIAEVIAGISLVLYAVLIAPLCAIIELPLMAVVAVFSLDDTGTPIAKNTSKFLYVCAIACAILSAFFPPFFVPLALVALGTLIFAQGFDYYSKMNDQSDGHDEDDDDREEINPLGRPPSKTSIAVMLLVGLALVLGVVISVFFPAALPFTLPALAFGVSWLSTVAVLAVGATAVMGTSFVIGSVALTMYKDISSDKADEGIVPYITTQAKEAQVKQKGGEKAVEDFWNEFTKVCDNWTAQQKVEEANILETGGEEAAKTFHAKWVAVRTQWIDEHQAKKPQVRQEGAGEALEDFKANAWPDAIEAFYKTLTTDSDVEDELTLSDRAKKKYEQLVSDVIDEDVIDEEDFIEENTNLQDTNLSSLPQPLPVIKEKKDSKTTNTTSFANNKVRMEYGSAHKLTNMSNQAGGKKVAEQPEDQKRDNDAPRNTPIGSL